jgi:hypothetical protein
MTWLTDTPCGMADFRPNSKETGVKIKRVKENGKQKCGICIVQENLCPNDEKEVRKYAKNEVISAARECA